MASLLAKLSPNLMQELEAASATGEIAAAVKLRPEDESQAALSPEKTREVVPQLITRVEGKVGMSATDYFTLEMLGAFNVVAPKAFVEELLQQPEVREAISANEEVPVSRPSNPRQVKLPFPSVGVIVSVNEKYTTSMSEVIARLEAAGMSVENRMDAIGIITGGVGRDKIADLQQVEGISGVETTREFQLSPPDPEVQ